MRQPDHLPAQGPKWLWLVRNEPEVYEKTRYWFMAHTYAAFRMTGEYVLDHTAASMCEPMYSPSTRDWIPEWCEDVAPGLPLPRLMYANEVAGHITAEGTRDTGLPEGIPVAVGTSTRSPRRSARGDGPRPGGRSCTARRSRPT